MEITLALILQIFVLLNPLASFPFLLAVKDKKLNLKKVAFKAVFTAFIIAVIINFLGIWLFDFFGITINSFRIAGGIVLLLLGIDMVRSYEENHKKVGSTNSLIAIMATPLLTGPATISFITIKSIEIGTIPVFINLCAAFVLVGLVFMLFSVFIDKINTKVVGIISRVLGLFLSAIAIEMIATGIQGIIAGL